MVIGEVTEEQKNIINDIFVAMIIRQYKIEREMNYSIEKDEILQSSYIKQAK